MKSNVASSAPIVQLSIDVLTLPHAIDIAEMGLRCGVDWLEIGTPLVTYVGVNNLNSFTSRFQDSTTFLDAKVMDASGLLISSAADLGIDLVSICASASDATFRSAVATGSLRGVKVVGDLIAVADPIQRSKELMEIGVDYLYLHYGFDQHNEAPEDNETLNQIADVKALGDVKVGIVTADLVQGEQATRAGADILLVGHPFLMGEDAESALFEYVTRVKSISTQ